MKKKDERWRSYRKMKKVKDEKKMKDGEVTERRRVNWLEEEKGS